MSKKFKKYYCTACDMYYEIRALFDKDDIRPTAGGKCKGKKDWVYYCPNCKSEDIEEEK